MTFQSSIIVPSVSVRREGGTMLENKRIKKVKRNIRKFMKRHPKLCVFVYDLILILISVILEIWIQSFWENKNTEYVDTTHVIYYEVQYILIESIDEIL